MIDLQSTYNPINKGYTGTENHHPEKIKRNKFYLFDVHVIQMVLNKLYAGIEVGSVEFVGNVPSQGSELPPLLHYCVHEGHSIQHGLPLRHVGNVQEVLAQPGVGSLQTGFDSLRWFIGKFDGNLLNKKNCQMMSDLEKIYTREPKCAYEILYIFF